MRIVREFALSCLRGEQPGEFDFLKGQGMKARLAQQIDRIDWVVGVEGNLQAVKAAQAFFAGLAQREGQTTSGREQGRGFPNGGALVRKVPEGQRGVDSVEFFGAVPGQKVA